MPLFERQYVPIQSEGRTIPPAETLMSLGPVVNVVVSATPEHLQALEAAGQQLPAPIQGMALIDTGASITMVDQTVCQMLGLSPTGFQKIFHAAGQDDARPCYPVQISFPEIQGAQPILLPKAVSCDLKFGNPHYSLLFGRDLLFNVKFMYNGHMGRFELAF